MLSSNKKLNIAIFLVKKSVEIAKWFKSIEFNSYIKADDSPVTFADLAIQIFIVSKLKEFYPEELIIAEEDASHIDKQGIRVIKSCFNNLGIDIEYDYGKILNYKGKPGKKAWAIDPIDGTIGYQKNLWYSIGIGYLLSSEIYLSAIAVPSYDENGTAIFIAEKNKGAKASYGGKAFKAIEVSDGSDIQQAILCHSLHYNEPWVNDLAEKIPIKNQIKIDSMAKFCMVADGRADLYIKPMDKNRSFTWDFCQGDLIVREAGGKVTDLNDERLNYKGKNCLFSSPGLIASNKNLHKNTLQKIRDEIDILNWD